MHQTTKLNSKILTRIRYLAYSIPIACIMLLFAINLLNLVFQSQQTFAVPLCDDVEGYTTGREYGTSEDCAKSYTPILTTPGSEPVSPTISLTIDNKTGDISDKITAQYGTTNYSSHTVRVSASDITNYTLTLSGPAQLPGPSTINATAGATGANLANDTWGYAWENTSVTDANANYKALSSSVNLAGDKVANNSVDFSRKLAFAVKFSNDAKAGNYKADVNLSLVATPKAATSLDYVSWDRMVYMQDMSPQACESANIGTSKTLTDIRDNSTYAIAKLSDGKCWMTQNLRLSDKTMKTGLQRYLRSGDTNINNDSYYQIPASTDGAFDNTKSGSYYTNQQVRAAANDTYGAYYSYNVATLNKVASESSGTASYDICPKGWRLPTSGSGGEFEVLKNKGASSWTTNNSKNGYWLGGAANASGAAFFPAAGVVNTSGLVGTGSEGTYWSGTIYSADTAYRLYFGSTSISPANYYYRYFGFSVRCVAK